MALPAAWLSPPAAPWQLDAEPSSADHPVSCLEGATPGALSPCGCQAEGGLQTSFQSLEPCPYQEAWAAWASEAWGASPAPRQEMQWGEENWQFSLCHFNQPPLYKTYLLHLSTYKQINEGWMKVGCLFRFSLFTWELIELSSAGLLTRMPVCRVARARGFTQYLINSVKQVDEVL